MKKNSIIKTISIFCVASLALLSSTFGATNYADLQTKKKVKVGKTFTLRVYNTKKKVKWSFSKKKVLSLISTGKYKAKFKALKVGTSTVTAKVGGRKLKCNVKVISKKKGKKVYITDSGNKYHKAGCKYLKDSQIYVSLSWALDNGYTACKVCGG